MRSRPTRGVSGPLREWCQWVWLQADLAARATEKQFPSDGPRDWRDYCGIYERGLIEAAIQHGIFEPTAKPAPPAA